MLQSGRMLSLPNTSQASISQEPLQSAQIWATPPAAVLQCLTTKASEDILELCSRSHDESVASFGSADSAVHAAVHAAAPPSPATQLELSLAGAAPETFTSGSVLIPINAPTETAAAAFQMSASAAGFAEGEGVGVASAGNTNAEPACAPHAEPQPSVHMLLPLTEREGSKVAHASTHLAELVWSQTEVHKQFEVEARFLDARAAFADAVAEASQGTMPTTLRDRVSAFVGAMSFNTHFRWQLQRCVSPASEAAGIAEVDNAEVKALPIHPPRQLDQQLPADSSAVAAMAKSTEASVNLIQAALATVSSCACSGFGQVTRCPPPGFQNALPFLLLSLHPLRWSC